MPTDHDEIIRLRERQHDVSTRLVALELNQTILLKWRDEMEPVIAEMRDSDLIATAITERLTAGRAVSLSRRQVRLAIVSVTISAIGVSAAVIVAAANALRGVFQ